MWNKITDKLPTICVPVIVCFKGVVQHETYYLDCGDLPSGSVEHFWDRDGLDDGKIVESSDLWMPLPAPPTAKTMEGANLQTNNTGSPKCEQCEHYNNESLADICSGCSHFYISRFTLRAGA